MTRPPLIRCPLVHEGSIMPCDVAEMEPLMAVLCANRPPPSQPESYPRGTLLPDGRLDMCKQSIGSAGTRRLVDALANNHHVSALLLGTNGLQDEGAEVLASIMEEHKSLETVYLGCNRIRARGAEALCEAVAGNPRVRGLWLKRNPLGDEGVEHVARLLRTTQTLQVLDLVNCGMSESGFITLMEALRINTSLTHLYLGGNGLQPEAGVWMADAVRHHPKLKHLLLDANHLGDAGATALAGLPLITLGLGSNEIGLTGIQALAEYLPERLHLGDASSAGVLGCRSNEVGDAGDAVLAQAIPGATLRELTLPGGQMTDAVAESLLDAAWRSPTMRRLVLPVLGLKPWTRARLRDVIQQLESRHPSLPPVCSMDIRSIYR